MTERLKRFAPSPHAELAGNLSTGLLKLIALASMFIDHTGKVLFNNASDMRLLGRIAFPLYAWCMIVGFCRTRSVPKYLGRILQAGLVSQPLYYLALNTQGHLGLLIQETVAPLSAGFSFPGLWEVLYTVFLKKPNIFLTLFLGLCALWGIRQKKKSEPDLGARDRYCPGHRFERGLRLERGDAVHPALRGAEYPPRHRRGDGFLLPVLGIRL